LGCLYCGKDIGPLQLVRDDEFCSAVHRKQYASRLSKALLQLGAREAAPTRSADFFCLFPFQTGNSKYFALLDGFNHRYESVEYKSALPISVSPLLGGMPIKLPGAHPTNAAQTASLADPTLGEQPLRLPPAGLQIVLDVPAQNDGFATPPALAPLFDVSAAAAAERMILAAANPRAVASPIAEATPCLTLEAGAPSLSRAEQTRPLQVTTAPVPAQFVTPAAKTADPASAPVQLPKFEIAAADACIEPVPVPAVCDAFVPGPAADLVAVHVLPQSNPQSCDFTLTAADLRLPRFEIAAADTCIEPMLVPAACDHLMASPAAELVAIEVLAKCNPESCEFPVTARPVGFQFAAAAISADSVPFPACDAWMPSPAAEPVAVEVVVSSAHEDCGVSEWMLPDLRRFAIADPWMPLSTRLHASLSAEPVSMTVWPLAAMVDEPAYNDVAEPRLPGPQHLPSGNQGSRTTPLQPAVAGLKPELVERMVAAEAHPVEAAMDGARVLQMPAFIRQDLRPATRLAGQAMGPLAEPVETMPSFEARQASPAAAAIELQLPSLPAPQAEAFAITPSIPAMPSQVRLAQPAAVQHPIVVKPLPTLFVTAPQPPQPEEQQATIAARGFVSLEFFTQRTPGTPSRKMVWCVPVIAPVLPGFAVHPILERLEKEPQQKKPKKPAFAEIFEMPEAARKKAGNAMLRHAIKAIAACFLVGTILWFGLGTVRIGSQTPAVNRDVSIGDLASGGSSGSASPVAISPVPGAPRSAKPAGALGKLRAAISDRAAATVTDSFKNGMEAWGTASKQWAPGWSRNPDGFVRTGQLALFRPTLTFKDYHLEFFGQIESRSMGWAVRAHDSQNYYAMKLAVVEPGLRPMIAMVHYAVVGGKRGRPIQIPLNIMVHNNEPMQVSVDVKGNKLLTSVDGQLVDTWIDDTLVAGGVGFFSDAGERARLYWMKISKNEDFVGRICAYISSTLGDGTRASAELWPRELPGEPQHQPLPVPERSQEAALAATAAGLQNRFTKDRRTQRWNS
jgi:hypothetical protein